MTKLISKIQYDNFETGEFVDEQERTYEETIALVENFPWLEQSTRNVTDLTKASITILGRQNDYLKLAVFYKGKYLLHYLDKKERIFTKSFDELEDTYQYLRVLFTESFGTTDFRKEITLFQNNVRHFTNHHFNYTVSAGRIGKYLLSTSGIYLAISALFLFIFPFYEVADWVFNFVMIVFIFFLGGGINLILFFNYFFSAKDKKLIMSQGNDLFYYGNINAPVLYNKNDILRCTIFESRVIKSPIAGFAFVKIELKDGTIFKIPNLLIDEFNLVHKLHPIHTAYKYGFPFLKK